MKNKCIVMFSNGLDSRLAVKIMKQNKWEILIAFFKLPFSKNIEEEVKKFSKKEKIKLKIFDCTKNTLLKEYLGIIRNPKYQRGTGINPCIDCKIFMFKKVKKFADKNSIEVIVSGEILGQRPLSQTKNFLNIIEKKSQLKNRLFRPLSAKLLPETKAEKKGLIKKKNFYDFQGRQRINQMTLAKKFKISYPTPAGGCLLCEKALKERFNKFLKRKLNSEQVELMSIGRHFIIKGCWIVLGRNEFENKIIEKTKKSYKKIIPKFKAPSAVILDKHNKSLITKVNKLIKAYSEKGSLNQRKQFEKYKI